MDGGTVVDRCKLSTMHNGTVEMGTFILLVLHNQMLSLVAKALPAKQENILNIILKIYTGIYVYWGRAFLVVLNNSSSSGAHLCVGLVCKL